MALVFIVCATLMAPAQAQTQRGNWQLSIGGAYTYSSIRTETEFGTSRSDAYSLALQTRASYFVADNVELGGTAVVSWSGDDDSSTDDQINTTLSFDSIYNFSPGRGSTAVPYVGAGVGAYIFDTNGDFETWPEVHGIVGLKMFASEDASFFVEWRPQYIFADSDSPIDSIVLSQIFFGTSFYF